jgi:hypothetical protein
LEQDCAVGKAQKLILLIVFLLGFVYLSVTFKVTQNLRPGKLTEDLSIVSLNDRQRAYIDHYTESTKWLVGLAYAMLTGLAAKRFNSPEDVRFESFMCLLAASFLVLSLYAGFLSQQAILIALISRPFGYLGSMLTSYPLAAQMFLLVAGTGALVFTFFQPSKKGD